MQASSPFDSSDPHGSSHASSSSSSSSDKASEASDAFAEEAKRQSQKMEALGRLAGGVAHDFNNLLTAINGYADLLLSLLAKSDPNRELAEEIRKAGEKGAALTRQLLAFSRKQRAEIKPQDLRPVLGDMEKLLSRLLPGNIQLAVIPAAQAMVSRVDRNLVEQALINLVVNARDAMPQGGQIRLSLSQKTINSWPERAPLKPAPGDFIALHVGDTGTGISAEVLAHLFEPFYTTKSKGRGTGLGLSTVYGIAQQLDGGIEVQTEVGKGTVFTLCFPAAKSESQAEKPVPENDMPHGQGEIIALMESDETLRRLTKRILQQAGYRVAEFFDIPSLLGGMPFDAVILEMEPRGGHGLDIAKTLLAQGQTRGVILMAGAQIDPDAVTLPQKVMLLSMPIRSKDLLRSLQTVIQN